MDDNLELSRRAQLAAQNGAGLGQICFFCEDEREKEAILPQISRKTVQL